MSTLPTAFIALQGARVRLEGGSLVVEHAAHPPSIIQLAHLGGLVALGGIEFTTPALIALAQRGIGCVLATRGGRVRAIVTSPTARHCELRRMQHALEVERAQAETNAPRPLEFARRSVRAKLDALLGILVQHHRTHDDVELSSRSRSFVRCATASNGLHRLISSVASRAPQWPATSPRCLRCAVANSRPPRVRANRHKIR